MANTHETIADIRKDAEAKFRELVKAYMQRRAAFQTTVGAMQAFNTVFDRLDAAHKREKAAIEADALAVGGIVGASHMREMSKNVSKNASNFGQLGDAAKLREALEHLLHGEYRDRCEVTNIAHAALAAPPRNCDLARDWMRDLYAHFQPPASVKREMPPEWVDAVMAFCRWLIAPATEQEGGNK